MLSRPTSMDPRYEDLSSREAIRQAERDALIYDQNKLLKERNELLRKQSNGNSYSSSKPLTFTENIISIIFSTLVLGGVAAVACYLSNFSTFSIILSVVIGIIIFCAVLEAISDYNEAKKNERITKAIIESRNKRNRN